MTVGTTVTLCISTAHKIGVTDLYSHHDNTRNNLELQLQVPRTVHRVEPLTSLIAKIKESSR